MSLKMIQLVPLVCLLLVVKEMVALPVAEQTKILTCSGQMKTDCKSKLCTVSCSDGSKVDLQCQNNSVSIESDGSGKTKVTCGKKMKACFPFC